jgi:hypothetical protein
MMASPVPLFGGLMISTGLIFIIAGWKNKAPFGEHGFLTEAIRDKKVTGVLNTAPMIGAGAETGRIGGDTAAIAAALLAINGKDPALGARVSAELAAINGGKQDLTLFNQLMALVDAKGLRNEATILREYVANITQTNAF